MYLILCIFYPHPPPGLVTPDFIARYHTSFVKDVCPLIMLVHQMNIEVPAT